MQDFSIHVIAENAYETDEHDGIWINLEAHQFMVESVMEDIKSLVKHSPFEDDEYDIDEVGNDLDDIEWHNLELEGLCAVAESIMRHGAEKFSAVMSYLGDDATEAAHYLDVYNIEVYDSWEQIVDDFLEAHGVDYDSPLLTCIKRDKIKTDLLSDCKETNDGRVLRIG